MSELGNDLDVEMDAVGEGMLPSDDDSVTQDTGGQGQVGSQTEPDLDQPMFAFTGEDGAEKELTGKDILAALEAAEKLGGLESEMQQLKDQLTQAQKPAEKAPDQAAQDQGDFQPIDYAQSGIILTKMLEGDDELGGPEAIGPALREFNIRQAATDPVMHHVIGQVVRNIMAENQTKETFVKDFGDMGAQKAAIDQWRQSNPAYARATDTEAYAYMTIQQLRGEIDSLKTVSGKAIQDAETTGKKAGEAATVKSLKAKGTLRALGGVAGQRQASVDSSDLKKQFNISDPEQRSLAMAEHVKRMRGGAG